MCLEFGHFTLYIRWNFAQHKHKPAKACKEVKKDNIQLASSQKIRFYVQTGPFKASKLL